MGEGAGATDRHLGAATLATWLGPGARTRATRLAYLADWRSAIETGAQLSDIRWTATPGGPTPADPATAAVLAALRGRWGRLPRPGRRRPDRGARATLRFVRRGASRMGDTELGRLVASTYPMLGGGEYPPRPLDLGILAARYREVRHLLLARTPG